MPQRLRVFLLNLRDLLLSAGHFAFLAVGLLVLAYWWLKPTPPKQVTLATGPAQGAYAEFGQRYQQALAAQGITVHLLESQGSQDNLRLLREGQADLGFVQGGSADPAATSGQDNEDDMQPLVSLGSLFVEPVWLFYRENSARPLLHGLRDARLDSLAQFKNLRMNVGTPGSGVPSLMGRLFDANRMEPASLRLAHLEQTPATVDFLEGRLDALVFVSAPEAPMVQMLLQTPGVRLMDFAQSEAYARRFPFLTPVTLPRGVVDLAANVPPRSIRLVATTTTLLAREDTHPALLQLFAQTAQALHGSAGWFNRAREFPNLHTGGEYPIAPEAERALNQPEPLMQRYLPFWLANLVQRMWLALGLIVAMLLPLSRIVPPLYAHRVRSRVFRWYGRLRDIEQQMETRQPAGNRQALADELDRLDTQVEKVSVPLSYADELYALRNHIRMVRDKLRG